MTTPRRATRPKSPDRSALGPRATRARTRPAPLWSCPRCGRPFANRNQEHSCVRVSIASHLKNRPPSVVALYRRFERMVRDCGPTLLAPAAGRIGFQVRMIFAAVRFTNSGLRAHVVLARRLDDTRFTKIQTISPRNHVHHFNVDAPEDLDARVARWLAEAYRVGCQEHLKR